MRELEELLRNLENRTQDPAREIHTRWDYGPQQPSYDPYLNAYNPGWQDHPHMSCANQQETRMSIQNLEAKVEEVAKLEDLVKSLAQSMTTMTTVMIQFQQETRASIQNLEIQVGQLAEVVSKLEAKEESRLSLQTQQIQSVSDTTQLNGRNHVEPFAERDVASKNHNRGVPDSDRSSRLSTYIDTSDLPRNHPRLTLAHWLRHHGSKGRPSAFVAALTNKFLDDDPPGSPSHEYIVASQDDVVCPNPPPLHVEKPPPSLPKPMKDHKRLEQNREPRQTIGEHKVNLSLLNMMHVVPQFSKYIRGLCLPRKNKKLTGKTKLNEHVSAVFERRLPEKCSDPGMFSIPCIIGDSKFDHCMIDLGSSINVLPYSVYQLLDLGPLRESKLVIKLADGSRAYPKGIVEDVLVKVNKIIFPADFVVLESAYDVHAPPILLGRPFLKTANTKIDVSKGTVSVKFGGDRVVFNMLDFKHPPDKKSVICSGLSDLT